MRKMIAGKYIDPSMPGVAYQLATWERNRVALGAENRRQARLHAAIMMRVPLTKRCGGVFNG